MNLKSVTVLIIACFLIGFLAGYIIGHSVGVNSGGGYTGTHYKKGVWVTGGQQ